jgi:hypothetical protein
MGGEVARGWFVSGSEANQTTRSRQMQDAALAGFLFLFGDVILVAGPNPALVALLFYCRRRTTQALCGIEDLPSYEAQAMSLGPVPGPAPFCEASSSSRVVAAKVCDATEKSPPGGRQ